MSLKSHIIFMLALAIIGSSVAASEPKPNCLKSDLSEGAAGICQADISCLEAAKLRCMLQFKHFDTDANLLIATGGRGKTTLCFAGSGTTVKTQSRNRRG